MHPGTRSGSFSLLQVWTFAESKAASVEIHMSLTFYSQPNHMFFGKTWRSPFTRLTRPQVPSQAWFTEQCVLPCLGFLCEPHRKRATCDGVAPCAAIFTGLRLTVKTVAFLIAPTFLHTMFQIYMFRILPCFECTPRNINVHLCAPMLLTWHFHRKTTRPPTQLHCRGCLASTKDAESLCRVVHP